MKPLEWPLLADENITPGVIEALRQEGANVAVASENPGSSDREVLRRAHAEGRVVLTHDSDLGTIALRQKEPFVGIIYMRPGHVRAEFVLEALRVADRQVGHVTPPFVLVIDRRNDRVRIRLRQGADASETRNDDVPNDSR